MWLLLFWVSGTCLELVHVGVGLSERGEEEEGRGGWGRLLPRAPDGLCRSASGRRLRGAVPRARRRPRAAPGVSPFAPRWLNGRVLAPGLPVSPLSGLWPPAWFGAPYDARVAAMTWPPRFPARALWRGKGAEGRGPDRSRRSPKPSGCGTHGLCLCCKVSVVGAQMFCKQAPVLGKY